MTDLVEVLGCFGHVSVWRAYRLSGLNLRFGSTAVPFTAKAV